MSASLEERIRRIEDRLELLELPGRYSRAIDDRDMPALVELFCEDGVFRHADGSRDVVGREEIERFYREVLGGYGMSIHIPHAQVVDAIDGDDASGWVLAHAELAVGDDYVNVALRYGDTYRRVGGRWRFARRDLSFWYFAKWSELSEIVPSAERMRSGRPPDLPESLASYADFVAARDRGAR